MRSVGEAMGKQREGVERGGGGGGGGGWGGGGGGGGGGRGWCLFYLRVGKKVKAVYHMGSSAKKTK